MPETKPEEEFGVLIEGHTYDGIKEYDNPMPKWWLYTFYASIVWGVFYLVGINVGWIDTYEDTLKKENARIDAIVAQAAEASPEITPEYLREAVDSGEYLESGKAAFAAYCASCHGQNGEGLVGPNLTDSSWLHGGSLMDIYTVADQGVLEKAMPAWGAVLKHDGLLGVVSYIDSIRDTNVEGGKEAQGTVYKPE
ncbi:cbb3-type cytochrome c oxidase N-terminal domain-containing protein [Bradymonas sediminis]|nr:cbb3-type cytochrome c oxidase N-terminal domain-containing protein [Bradymonas sediminis]TDP62685.1 cytochrome c oxidase cbb3-type subunit 3 [Bradymonas sediminis]